MTATDWTFGGTWPHEPKWFDTPNGRMHYVDEGPRGGRPVVMVHGNPTWGYLYRHFVGPWSRPAIGPSSSITWGSGAPTSPRTPNCTATNPAPSERLWLDTFPDAEVLRIPDASHFVQEDAHGVVVPELIELVGRRSNTRLRNDSQAGP